MAAQPREVGTSAQRAAFKTVERDEEGLGYACAVTSTHAEDGTGTLLR